jgi:hypothetical protein
MNHKDQTIRLVVDDGEDSLYEIKNQFGSKIITAQRLIEITPWTPKTVKQGRKEFQRNVDLEISRSN